MKDPKARLIRWAAALLILALPTLGCAAAEPAVGTDLPPMQESFADLYAQNPDVVASKGAFGYNEITKSKPANRKSSPK